MSTSPIDPSGELRALASDCVHCGFCLPVCPTYQLWGEEMDSPRGRIHLITQILDGAAAGETVAGGTVAGEATATHLDRCLGCMACVPACPSGVHYDRLIEAARGWAEEPPGGPAPAPLPPRSSRERAARAAIFATFPYPARLRLLTRPLRAAQRTGMMRRIEGSRLAARLAPELVASLRVAPSPPRGHHAALARRVPAQGPRRAVVGLLTGCVQQVFFPGVNEATVRVLAAEGCDVVIPRRQGCCGALSLHSGRAAEAAGFARRTMTAFEGAGVDVVVVNSAGCGSAMKEYSHLFGGDGDEAQRAKRFTSTVRDLSEFLAELAADGGPRAARHPLPVTAVYHEACHLGHAQGIRRQPRELLRGIPGLELVEPADPGTCCGSAGVYNLLQPEAAGELGARKAASVLATGAPLVISANPGCSLQISAAMAAAGTVSPPAMAHIAEVLDASLRGLPVTELTGRPVPGPAATPPAEPVLRQRASPAQLAPVSQSGSSSPSATITAGPVSQLVPASRVTVSAPPGTMTCHWPGTVFVAEERAAAAAAAATAPVPQARVSPEPRSCTRMLSVPGPVTRTSSTLPPAGKSAGSRPGGSARSNLSSASSTRQARCGLPTLIRRPSRTAPPITVRPGPSTLTGPMSTVIRPSGSARTWRTPDRVATANAGLAARPCSSR